MNDDWEEERRRKARKMQKENEKKENEAGQPREKKYDWMDPDDYD
jgi:hypothetical protein